MCVMIIRTESWLPQFVYHRNRHYQCYYFPAGRRCGSCKTCHVWHSWSCLKTHCVICSLTPAARWMTRPCARWTVQTSLVIVMGRTHLLAVRDSGRDGVNKMLISLSLSSFSFFSLPLSPLPSFSLSHHFYIFLFLSTLTMIFVNNFTCMHINCSECKTVLWFCFHHLFVFLSQMSCHKNDGEPLQSQRAVVLYIIRQSHHHVQPPVNGLSTETRIPASWVFAQPDRVGLWPHQWPRCSRLQQNWCSGIIMWAMQAKRCWRWQQNPHWQSK